MRSGKHLPPPALADKAPYSLANSYIMKQGLNIGQLYMTFNIKREIRGDWHSRYLITCIMGIMLDYLCISVPIPLVLPLTSKFNPQKVWVGLMFYPCLTITSVLTCRAGQHFGYCMIVPSTAAEL